MDLLWTAFLNSEWHDWRGAGLPPEDRLEKPEWQRWFLSEYRLTAPVPPTPTDLAALRELRRFLRDLTEKLAAGGAVASDDLARLNRAMAGGPVIRHLAEGPRLELLPAGRGWQQVMAEVAASFAHTLTEGEGARVRICENPDCRWVFYDDTRNRTKRYCDDKTCGNLMKVRRFRARRKEGRTE